VAIPLRITEKPDSRAIKPALEKWFPKTMKYHDHGTNGKVWVRIPLTPFLPIKNVHDRTGFEVKFYGKVPSVKNILEMAHKNAHFKFEKPPVTGEQGEFALPLCFYLLVSERAQKDVKIPVGIRDIVAFNFAKLLNIREVEYGVTEDKEALMRRLHSKFEQTDHEYPLQDALNKLRTSSRAFECPAIIDTMAKLRICNKEECYFYRLY
jgi:hypothetical protein